MQEAGLDPSTTQVLVLHPKTLQEVLDSIISIGTAAGVADRAQQLVTDLQARLAQSAAAVRQVCPAAAAVTAALTSVRLDKTTLAANGTADSVICSGSAVAPAKQQPQQQPDASAQAIESAFWQQAPRVLGLEGLNPLVLGGQWLPDVKLAAGCIDASGQQPGDPPTRITWEQVGVVCGCVSLVFGGGGGGRC